MMTDLEIRAEGVGDDDRLGFRGLVEMEWREEQGG